MFFLVAQAGCFFKKLGFHSLVLAFLDFRNAGFHVADVVRAGHLGDALARARFIQDVDGLVRQEPARQIAVGELGCGFNGFLRIMHLVMFLILGLDAGKNLDGVLHGGFPYLHLLEAAFQGGVLLNVFPVFVERGGAYGLELTPGEGGLDDVGGVHGAFRGAGAYNGVQFINEKDDIAFPAYFIHYGLEPFLKLAAVFGAGHHQRQVQGDDPLAAQELRNMALGYFLGQPFHDGGFAHPGFTEQDGVVFVPPAQNLDDALNFRGAADDGIQLAVPGQLGHVPAKGLERGGLGFLLPGVGGGGRLVRRDGGGFIFLLVVIVVRDDVVFIRIHLVFGGQHVQQFAPRLFQIHAEVAQNLSGHAVAVTDEAQEQVFRAHIRVVEFLGFPVCHCQDFAHPGGVRDVALRLGFRAPAYLFLHLFAHGGKLHAQIFQDGDGHALAQLEQAEQKVFGSYVMMIEAVRFPARMRQHLLRPRRKIIHGWSKNLYGCISCRKVLSE